MWAVTERHSGGGKGAARGRCGPGGEVGPGGPATELFRAAIERQECGGGAGAASARGRRQDAPTPSSSSSNAGRSSFPRAAGAHPGRRQRRQCADSWRGWSASGGGGLTALVFAAREGDIESARALLDAGADVNQTTEYGWTPLLTAINNRNYALAALLIERGADVNLANKGGWTPLYLATDNRNIEGGDYPVPKPDRDHLELIKLLLDKGANPNARVSENTLTRTIFTMQWFFEEGATAFVRAAQSRDTELLKLLLQYGADPNIATANGDTALTAAAGIGWVEGVTFERSREENLEAIRMLLDLGLDPNHANNDGRTPLMGAALKGRNPVDPAARRPRRAARYPRSRQSRHGTSRLGRGRIHVAGARLRGGSRSGGRAVARSRIRRRRRSSAS